MLLLWDSLVIVLRSLPLPTTMRTCRPAPWLGADQEHTWCGPSCSPDQWLPTYALAWSNGVESLLLTTEGSPFPFPGTECCSIMSSVHVSSGWALTIQMQMCMLKLLWQIQLLCVRWSQFSDFNTSFFSFYSCHMLRAWKTSFKNHIFTS